LTLVLVVGEPGRFQVQAVLQQLASGLGDSAEPGFTSEDQIKLLASWAVLPA
jgi:hypothetical protein